MSDLKGLPIDAVIALEVYVTLFVALHDWLPLGRLNDVKAVHAAEPVRRLIAVTILSTLPFAIGAAETVLHRSGFPGWLMIFLWISYGVAAYGLLRTWWAPYLLFEEPERAARYQKMHGRTHAFLPMHNGMRPNTLHVTVHLAIVAILSDLAILTFLPVGQ
jgi:hypothetical protein